MYNYKNSKQNIINILYNIILRTINFTSRLVFSFKIWYSKYHLYFSYCLYRYLYNRLFAGDIWQSINKSKEYKKWNQRKKRKKKTFLE